jgi:hypothetical protein
VKANSASFGTTRSYADIVRSNILNFFNGILVTIAALLIGVGRISDAVISIGPLFLANAVIRTAVLTDGLAGVEAACSEALSHGVHSADVILNILARRRDPGPPITILTPAALRLHQPPAADCARYDTLRRPP